MSSSETTRQSRKIAGLDAGLDAGLGPARPLSPAADQRLVERIVKRARYPEQRPLSRRLSLRALSLAALAVVTSAAAAALLHHELGRNPVTSAPVADVPERPIKKPMPGVAVQRPARLPSAQPTASADAPTLAREARPSAGRSSSAVVSARVTAAVDELSAANDLRRQAQWRAAEAAYREIAARYPEAPEAAVAQLAAAELRLEHLGDPAGALRSYEAVPRRSALGVEALFGVSRAQRALGNRSAEAAALRSLLEAYPTSLQADRARERLAQLTAESMDH